MGPETRRILITGCSGFIGSALLKTLCLQNNRYIIGICRRPLPQTANIVKACDLGDTAELRAAIEGADTIIHTAGRAHVMKDTAPFPLDEFRHVNVHGTMKLARQAVSAGVRRFIFLSSIKVNGEETFPGKPFSITSPPAPQDAYSISKYEAEIELLELSAKTGMEVVIIRLPLVYGPGVKGNFRSLIDIVRRGFPLPLGSVRNLRSLIALDNLVDFICLCIEHPAAANRTLLVADGKDLSTPALVRGLAQAMHKPARLVPLPVSVLKAVASLTGKTASLQRLCGNLQVDMSHAQKLLGWNPPISVDEGLRRTVTQ